MYVTYRELAETSTGVDDGPDCMATFRRVLDCAETAVFTLRNVVEGVRADPRTVSPAWDPGRKNCAVAAATVSRCPTFHSWRLSPPFGDLMADWALAGSGL